MAEDKTGELFGGMMASLAGKLSGSPGLLYDVRIYPSGYFSSFSPLTQFTKFALIESPLIPDLEPFDLIGGKYAVFECKNHQDAIQTYTYIFTKWLAESGFVLDERPHYDVSIPTGKKDFNAPQTIFIPVL